MTGAFAGCPESWVHCTDDVIQSDRSEAQEMDVILSDRSEAQEVEGSAVRAPCPAADPSPVAAWTGCLEPNRLPLHGERRDDRRPEAGVQTEICERSVPDWRRLRRPDAGAHARSQPWRKALRVARVPSRSRLPLRHGHCGPADAGWTLLLFWTSRRPANRAPAMAFTAIVVAGLLLAGCRAVASGFLSLSNMLPVFVLQLVLIALFAIAYLRVGRSGR
jgi:hypothetical protein